MFDKNDIKRRFETEDRLIDRHGNFVNVTVDIYVYRIHFPVLLHYHLLSGMTDSAALLELRANDLSDFEAHYVLKNSIDFIYNVLDIDLEEVRKNRSSTVELCNKLITKIISDLNAFYEKNRYLPIDIDGVTYQADSKARESMLSYLVAERAVDYWVVENNERIRLTLDGLKHVYARIAERDAVLHEKISSLKTEGRTYAERHMYAQLVELSEHVCLL